MNYEGEYVMAKENAKENVRATQILKEKFGDKVELPSEVDCVLENNDCIIRLNPQKVQVKNMQEDANAFEAWAVALYIALGKSGKITLDVNGSFKQMGYEQTGGHWSRFLYRALRFSEQYKWFKLGGEVETEVKKFKEYLENNSFTNNLPEGEAGIKGAHNDENVVEATFAEYTEFREKIGGNPVSRQLPVGLFRITDESEKGKLYKYTKDKKVFTGGKSAIDLWSWREDEFEVIELKTKNIMAGIITEIFFYTNYMYDFLVGNPETFRLNRYNNESKNDCRGYKNISGNEFRKVRGIMLADKYHPILNSDEVLKVLNKNGDVGIKYVQAKYEFNIDINIKRCEV